MIPQPSASRCASFPAGPDHGGLSRPRGRIATAARGGGGDGRGHGPPRQSILAARAGPTRQGAAGALAPRRHADRSQLPIVRRCPAGAIGAGKIEFDLAIDPDAAAALTALIAAIEAANAVLLPSPTTDPLTVIMSDALGGGYGDDDYSEISINGCALQIPPEDPPSNIVAVTLFCGPDIIASRLISSELVFRLPAGYRKDHFSVQVNSQCAVKEIRLAETAGELRAA